MVCEKNNNLGFVWLVICLNDKIWKESNLIKFTVVWPLFFVITFIF